jgi:hypothetical protein
MTAQDIIEIASPEEVNALKAYFGPNWVYKAMRQEEDKPQHGLQYIALTVEGEQVKAPARDAWNQIKTNYALWVLIGLRKSADNEPQESFIQSQHDSIPSHWDGPDDNFKAIPSYEKDVQTSVTH